MTNRPTRFEEQRAWILEQLAPIDQLRRWIEQHRLLVGAAGVVGLSLLGFGLLAEYYGSKEQASLLFYEAAFVLMLWLIARFILDVDLLFLALYYLVMPALSITLLLAGVSVLVGGSLFPKLSVLAWWAWFGVGALASIVGYPLWLFRRHYPKRYDFFPGFVGWLLLSVAAASFLIGFVRFVRFVWDS